MIRDIIKFSLDKKLSIEIEQALNTSKESYFSTVSAEAAKKSLSVGYSTALKNGYSAVIDSLKLGGSIVTIENILEIKKLGPEVFLIKKPKDFFEIAFNEGVENGFSILNILVSNVF